MKTIDLVQGSPEWLAHRVGKFNASDAPAMMGCSPHKTRAELVRELATGQVQEHSDYVRRRVLDKGHAFEGLALPLADEYAGDMFSPACGVSDTDPRMAASFDGLNFDGLTGWEHKSLNQALRDVFTVEGATGADLPLMYRLQMEHQALVGGLQRVMFTASEWAGDALVDIRHCWYTPDPALAAQIVAGWMMLAEDVANYAPQEAKPMAQAIESLPSLRIVATGEVTSSNLPQFKAAALAVINSFPRELTTDQDFADAEKRVKWCAEVEDKVAAAIEGIQSQNASIDDAVRSLREIASAARDQRLHFSKAVTTEKDARRTKLIADAEKRLADFVAAKNVLLQNVSAGRYTPPSIRPALLESIKGLKSIDSMTGKLAAVVAQAIAQVEAVTSNLQTNAETLTAAGSWHLFIDFAEKGQKAPEDFGALLAQRQAQFREAVEYEASRRAEAEAAHQAAKAADPAKAANEPIPAPAPAGTVIRLGELNVLLAPCMVNAASLENLGFAVSKQGPASVVQACDLPAICDALIAKLTRVRDASRKAA